MATDTLDGSKLVDTGQRKSMLEGIGIGPLALALACKDCLVLEDQGKLRYPSEGMIRTSSGCMADSMRMANTLEVAKSELEKQPH